MPNDFVHPYEKLTLSDVGWPLAIYLILLHLFMLIKADFCKEWLVKASRNYQAGVIVMGLALGWFWLHVAPDKLSLMSFLSALSMDLAEFNALKPMIRIAVPLFFIGMCLYVREFLFVRGLGMLTLMLAGPILQAAQFKDEPTRILLPIFAYMILTIGLYCVGMPYLFRDTINWFVARHLRYQLLVLAGLAYGLAVLACTLFIW